jgi:hypothetical protein
MKERVDEVHLSCFHLIVISSPLSSEMSLHFDCSVSTLLFYPFFYVLLCLLHYPFLSFLSILLSLSHPILLYPLLFPSSSHIHFLFYSSISQSSPTSSPPSPSLLPTYTQSSNYGWFIRGEVIQCTIRYTEKQIGKRRSVGNIEGREI